MAARVIGKLLKDAGMKFWEDSGPRLSAAITFYLALYLSPMLLTVVAIVGIGFGQDAVRGEIVEQIRGFVGDNGAIVIEQLIAQSTFTGHGVWEGVIAAITLLIGATGLFTNLQSALNAIWRVPGRNSEGGILSLLRERFLAFALVCGTAFLVVVSLLISMILTAINQSISRWLPGTDALVEITNFALGYFLMCTLFAMIFKWLPETHLKWSDIWLGAVITAGLIALARYPIGLYLKKVAVGSAFGAAEALVVFLIWVYYSTQILLFGAELTFVYSNRHGYSAQARERQSRTAKSGVVTMSSEI
jgi:membrane protein